MWRVRTGSPWRDLPAAYDPWQTVYDRHRRWSADGTREKVLDAPRSKCDLDLTAEEGGWAVSIDSSMMRAHHDAAGAKSEPPRDVPPERLAAQASPSPGNGVVRGVITGHLDPEAARRQASREREGLERFRGGLSSKVHLLADARCRVRSALVSAGTRRPTRS